MRVSFATVSIREIFRFNVVVHDILNDVKELMTLPSNSELTLRFYKDDQDESVYETKAKYEDATDGELTYDPVDGEPNRRASFQTPKGCNTVDIFDWLYSEVAILAFTMSQGRVLPNVTLPEGVIKGEDGVFEMGLLMSCHFMFLLNTTSKERKISLLLC